MLSDRDRALIGRSVARLREHGWPAGKALGLVADGTTDAGARAELTRMSEALERGDDVSSENRDPLLRMLASGERAGAPALE